MTVVGDDVIVVVVDRRLREGLPFLDGTLDLLRVDGDAVRLLVGDDDNVRRCTTTCFFCFLVLVVAGRGERTTDLDFVTCFFFGVFDTVGDIIRLFDRFVVIGVVFDFLDGDPTFCFGFFELGVDSTGPSTFFLPPLLLAFGDTNLLIFVLDFLPSAVL